MERTKKDNRLPIFTERFRELQGDLSNTDYADYLGISRQTVGFYCNGDRLPDVVTLLKIAEKCNVSTDYLLGKSDVKTADPEIQSICDYTGLSEESLHFLHTFIADRNEAGVYPAGFTDDDYSPKRLINDFLEQDPFAFMVEFCDGMNDSVEPDSAIKIIREDEPSAKSRYRGQEIERLTLKRLANLKIELAKSRFAGMLDFIYWDFSDSDQ